MNSKNKFVTICITLLCLIATTIVGIALQSAIAWLPLLLSFPLLMPVALATIFYLVKVIQEKGKGKTKIPEIKTEPIAIKEKVATFDRKKQLESLKKLKQEITASPEKITKAPYQKKL